MVVVADLPEREPVAPEVAAAPVPRVERLRVDAVEAVHGSRERFPWALDDEVVVVRHQAERVDVESERLYRPTEQGQEESAVLPVEEDAPPLDTARRHVPDAVGGKHGSRKPRHGSSVRPPCSRTSPVDELARNCCERHRREGTCPGTVPGHVLRGRWLFGAGRAGLGRR